jgi:prophage regulatory protein
MPQAVETKTADNRATIPAATIPDKPKLRKGYNPAADIVAPRHLPDAAGISTTTAWRLRKRGLFPAPVRLSPGRVGWRKSDIDRWLAERQAGSR